MAADIVMPRIYKGMSEGTLVKWFKKPGEFVRDGDLLFAVMSDKGSSDIEAETTGVLTEVLVAEGEKAAVSSKLGSISPAEQPQDSDAGAKAKEQAPPSAPAAPPAQKSSPLAKKLAESAQIDLSKVPSHGRVMAGDILEYLKSSDKAAPAGAAPENRGRDRTDERYAQGHCQEHAEFAHDLPHRHFQSLGRHDGAEALP